MIVEPSRFNNVCDNNELTYNRSLRAHVSVKAFGCFSFGTCDRWHPRKNLFSGHLAELDRRRQDTPSHVPHSDRNEAI